MLLQADHALAGASMRQLEAKLPHDDPARIRGTLQDR